MVSQNLLRNARSRVEPYKHLCYCFRVHGLLGHSLRVSGCLLTYHQDVVMSAAARGKGFAYVHGDTLEWFRDHWQRDHSRSGYLPVAGFLALLTAATEVRDVSVKVRPVEPSHYTGCCLLLTQVPSQGHRMGQLQDRSYALSWKVDLVHCLLSCSSLEVSNANTGAHLVGRSLPSPRSWPTPRLPPVAVADWSWLHVALRPAPVHH